MDIKIRLFTWSGRSASAVDRFQSPDSSGMKDREPYAQQTSGRSIFGWIEFPGWVAELPELSSVVHAACRKAKECEQYGPTIRLYDLVKDGRFGDLENQFHSHCIPFDCGGKDPVDGTPWAGWWRPGYRHPVRYEISSIGEEFITLDDLRSVIRQHEDDAALGQALRDLIARNDHSPPETLSHYALPCNASSGPYNIFANSPARRFLVLTDFARRLYSSWRTT